MLSQRYIFKIRSKRLAKGKWNIRLGIDEARGNEELIALASSQCLRWIDELNGKENVEERLGEIRRKINYLKNRCENSTGNRRKIRNLYNQRDELLFCPDYVCLVVERKADYLRAIKGFYINGIRYVRLLATTGGVKNSTVVFCSDRVHDELEKRINNGRDMTKEFVVAKLEAYRALTCSASNPVSMPRGILVVPDVETTFKADVVNLSDENDGEPVMTFEKDAEVSVTASDGFGIMLPSLAKRWSEELGLNYMISGCNCRGSFLKGMLYTFDFVEFAERVAGNYVVKDAWGEEHDIRDIECVFTTSQLKLWDSYSSIEDYLANCNENHYSFAVTKVCGDNLESERAGNYQYFQSFDLDDNDIDELIAPTEEEFRGLLGGDINKAILFHKGVGITPKQFKTMADDPIKAVMCCSDMLKDPYVKNILNNAIRSRISDAANGKIQLHGNYSIASGDPYLLCQNMFGLPLTGLLKAKEIYNKWWQDEGATDLICFRSPMSTHSNIRRVHVANNDDVNHWFKYMKTCTIFSGWSTEMAALNGMDYDGDLVMLTDNPVLLRRHKELPALNCFQRKATKIVPTELDFVQSNIDNFGSDIGTVTNRLTAMYERQALFEKDSIEYKTLAYRIEASQQVQQNAIKYCGLTQ